MNCHELQPMLRELAGEAGLEPEMRQAATLHLSRCPRCAARLAEERRLTAGLVELAQSMEGREAPAYVEHSLRDAFLARCEGPRSRFAFWTLSRREWSLRLAGVAAVLLIAVTGALLWRTPAPEAKPVAVEPAQHPTLQATQQAPLAAAGETLQARTPSPRIAAEEGRRTVAAAQTAEPQEEPKEAARAAEGGSDRTELRQPAMAEGFVPLFYGGDPGLLETGQVLRVELPTGVLESFGIPVHEELRARRVRADLLVGEDGTARAIRFVH